MTDYDFEATDLAVEEWLTLEDTLAVVAPMTDPWAVTGAIKYGSQEMYDYIDYIAVMNALTHECFWCAMPASNYNALTDEWACNAHKQ